MRCRWPWPAYKLRTPRCSVLPNTIYLFDTWQRAGDRYFRYVNDDDEWPRTPAPSSSLPPRGVWASVCELGGLPGEDRTSDGGRPPRASAGGWKLGLTFRGSPWPGCPTEQRAKKNIGISSHARNISQQVMSFTPQSRRPGPCLCPHRHRELYNSRHHCCMFIGHASNTLLVSILFWEKLLLNCELLNEETVKANWEKVHSIESKG